MPIKLKHLLNELISDGFVNMDKFRKNMYSWQKPDGEFIPVKDNHNYDAMGHLKSLDLLPAPHGDYVLHLFKKGWNRINFNCNIIYCENSEHEPNEKQKSKLIELALEANIISIVWDGGEIDKTIWSNNDVLEEGIEDVQFVSPNDTEIDYYNDLSHIEKESEINILSHMELVVIAIRNGKAVGALYESPQNRIFSFDVIVDKNERQQGIGSKLIDIGLLDYKEFQELGYSLRLIVVNKNLIPYLLKRGLKIATVNRGITIMTY